MLRDLFEKCRSYRRFDEKRKIDEEILLSFISNASITPSGANLQPLRYRIIVDDFGREIVFKHLKWAGYLTDWAGPGKNERPSSYILIFGDRTVSKNFAIDLGISAYAIVLSAAELGIGSCMLGSIEREGLGISLNIPDRYEILLIIALGYPAETVVLEEASGEGIKYYRDKNDVHHVPKRKVDEILI